MIMMAFQIVSSPTPVIGVSLGIQASPWLSPSYGTLVQQVDHAARVVGHGAGQLYSSGGTEAVAVGQGGKSFAVHGRIVALRNDDESMRGVSQLPHS